MTEGVNLQLLLGKDAEFKDRFLSPKARRRGIANNMRIQTEQMLTEGNDDPGDIQGRSATLLYLLARGANDPDSLPDKDYTEFASIVIEALANQGAGSEFGRHDRVLESVDAAIARIRAAGSNATDLLLAKVKYLSYAQNESAERLNTLRLAKETAANEDLMKVNYQMTWYLIDTSSYRSAIDLCNSSIELAKELSLDKWKVGFTTNRGIARYTTLNDPDAARIDLESAVTLARTLGDDNDVDINRFVADALHYLGRCALDDDDPGLAIRRYIDGRSYKARIPFESRAVAYFHIRMAEAITGAGNYVQAGEHLNAARSYLGRVNDNGSASVLYSYALANLHVAKGQLSAALQILEQGAEDAKNCRFARGRLLTLARIFTVRLKNKQLLRAAATLFRALPLLFSGELRRNSLLAITARFRNYASHVFRPYGSTAARSGEFTCPCEMHDQPI